MLDLKKLPFIGGKITKNTFFCNKAKNKEKWMGIASDIEMVWHG